MFKPVAIRTLSTRRLMTTDSQLLTKFAKAIKPVNRVSEYDSNASQFITYIQNNKYDKAMKMTQNGEVHVDAHTWGENTALTDAAKRGDTRGVNVLLRDFKANPYASCDCPYHKTAFHYAAENGHIDTLRVLLEFIGPDGKINILDNRGKTPLDVALNDKTAKMLKSASVIEGTKLRQHEKQVLFPK